MPKRSSPRSRASRSRFALVLDVGTTGVKAFVFDERNAIVARAYLPLKKNHPHPGWVEQDPHRIVRSSIEVLRRAVKEASVPRSRIVGLGISTQRETTLMWHHHTGKPLYPMIVWEDRRTAAYCKPLQRRYGKLVRAHTGLTVDPYFSASKARWILDHVRAARRMVAGEDVDFGTVDSWLMWNLIEGRPHLTDYTNASRTLLYDTRTLRWDDDLLALFGIPLGIVPNVKPSISDFGRLKKSVLGFSVPVRAVCGDQQAALFAAGTAVGTTKATYGTGTFVMQVLGHDFALHSGFMTTIAPGLRGPHYVLEAKVDDTARRVALALKKPATLKRTLTTIARETDRIIRRLPKHPREIVIDGGITRDGILAVIQRKISHVRIRPQRVFDGTALGMAKMVFKNA